MLHCNARGKGRKVSSESEKPPSLGMVAAAPPLLFLDVHLFYWPVLTFGPAPQSAPWQRVPDSDCRIMKRFRGGLVAKTHKLLYQSTLGSRVIQKKTTLMRESICGVLLFFSAGSVIDERVLSATACLQGRCAWENGSLLAVQAFLEGMHLHLC